MSRIDVSSRLAQIARHDALEADVVFGTRVGPATFPTQVNSISELFKAMNSSDRRFDFSIPIPEHRRPRNDLSLTTAPGWVMDGENLAQRVELALGNNSSIFRSSTVGNFLKTNRAKLPATDDLAQESTVVPYGQQVTAAATPFTDEQLDALTFGAPPLNVSRSLLNDCPYLAGSILDILTGRCARGMDRFFIDGYANPDGPGGLLNEAYAVTSGSPTAIALDDLFNMLAAVPAPYRESDRCAWFCHSAVEISLMRLCDSTGRPLWKAAGLDRWPRVLCDHLPSVIQAGAIPLLFGDMSAHHIGMFRNIEFQRAVEKLAEFDEDQFFAFAMCDAALVNAGSHPVVKLVMHS